MSSSDSSVSNDDENMDIDQEAQAITQELVAKKSTPAYHLCYQNFLKWKTQKNINDISENVILIFGFCGALRSGEYCSIKTQDVEDTGTQFIVTIRDTKNYYPRSFVIMNEYSDKNHSMDTTTETSKQDESRPSTSTSSQPPEPLATTKHSCKENIAPQNKHESHQSLTNYQNELRAVNDII
ncbi:hypothetical protein KQX54_004074 [Cotesia glomerata]|uniref:Uncharacterized protein n=1 Tax=Cotesia glomerata TaxID=32391 RepID=A0AAV7IUD2_COTGL|nr:hypothetical protein KQX54_004074 [Cotesia glomerata]